MAIALGMIARIIHGESRSERVEAAATLVMWFAAGAFATSTIASIFATPHEPSQLVDIAGGMSAVVAVVLFKAG